MGLGSGQQPISANASPVKSRLQALAAQNVIGTGDRLGLGNASHGPGSKVLKQSMFRQPQPNFNLEDRANTL